MQRLYCALVKIIEFELRPKPEIIEISNPRTDPINFDPGSRCGLVLCMPILRNSKGHVRKHSKIEGQNMNTVNWVETGELANRIVCAKQRKP